MIYVIDDDDIMADCIARACLPSGQVQVFTNGITAMQAMGAELPKLIFLDILLDGPDGFTLLHEFQSYTDTAAIPIVLVSSLDLSGQDLSVYGVVGILDKSTMTPTDIANYAERYCG